MSFPRYESYRDSGVEWLGDIPSDWDVKRFRFLFRESDEKIEAEIVGSMLSVSGYRGIEIKEYDDENRRRSGEELAGYRIVRRGQLVVNTMWLNYAGLGVSEHEGHVSPAYRSYWIRDALDSRYAHHLLRSSIYVQGYTRLLTGIRPNSLQMGRDDMMDFPVLLPPRTVQASIAAFLDRETAKIDALVEEQRGLIELLKEKRQAAISRAVTKGFDSSVAVTQTGIEWIGEIPAHWKIVRLARIAREGTSITYGIIQAGPEIDGGIPYIRTSDMSGEVLPRDGYMHTTPEIDASYSRSKVAAGDLVIAIRATIGKALLVPDYLDGANLTQGTARFSPGADCDAEFVRYFLIGPASAEFASIAKGATFKEITLEMLRKTRIALPPLSEQRAIVEQLSDVLAAIDGLISSAEEAVELLGERRAAIISGAVTGKFDVVRTASLQAAMRIATAAEIIRLSSTRPTFGRVKLQKLTYLAEAHIGITSIGGCYLREAAGPLDRQLMRTLEQSLSACGVACVEQDGGAGSQVIYRFTGDAKAVSAEASDLLGDKLAALHGLIKKTADLDTKSIEAVATLYAVWNDALIEGHTLTDDEIISGVLNDWHPEKREKFSDTDLRTWLAWMGRNKITPKGQGPKTTTGRLFP